MWLRLSRSEFEKHKGGGNRRALTMRVETGSAPPGLFAAPIPIVVEIAGDAVDRRRHASH